jgi:predicted ATPase
MLSWNLPQILAKFGLPAAIVQFLELQLDRLTVPEKRLLQAASLEGAEFTAAAVGVSLQQIVEEIEERCDDLSHRRLFIRRVDTDKEPDGRRVARYAFRHKLAQAFFYQRLEGTSRHTGWRKQYQGKRS